MTFYALLMLSLCRQEKEIIHNFINKTKTNKTQILTVCDLDIAVVKINLNTTDSFIPINASEVRITIMLT